MKVWVFITGDGYYGGWFSGVWESKENAEPAIEAHGWRRDPSRENGWKRRGHEGDLAEVDMNLYDTQMD